jgi:zinc transport system substrate-binding protein
MKYFAERIAGGAAEVVLPAPPGEDPAFWVPDRRTALLYQGADLIVLNGADFEKWAGRNFGKVSLPASRIVETARPFEDQLVILKEAVTHSHGPGGEHSHEGVVGYTWLDPRLAEIQAGEIARALTRLMPDRAADFARNLEALSKDLDDLNALLEEAVRGYDGRLVLGSHPVFHYVARRYKWNMHMLAVQPDSMPGERVLQDLKALLAATPARHVVWETTPAGEMARRLREDLGLESVVFETCGMLREEDARRGADYLDAMRANAARIRPAFAPADGKAEAQPPAAYLPAPR